MNGRLFIVATAFLAAVQSFALELKVRNDNCYSRQTVVQTDARPILAALGTEGCYIVDSDGHEVPSQLTSDSLLLFSVHIEPFSSAVFKAMPASKMHDYQALACGRVYPERADDLAWENCHGGYRVYGPGTQAKGERSYGYDIFFKRSLLGTPVLEDLYAQQCNPDNWRKVDSLRRIDKAQAEAFEKSFTYHVDHGKGMDCYAVGPTLGAGVAAPLLADGSISFPWCYSKAEIIDNGPLRFRVKLDFAPRKVGDVDSVVETRIITLDAYSLLNRCEVCYHGLPSGTELVMGFPLRDSDRTDTFADYNGLLAYADPTQGADNGQAYLGIIAPGGFCRVLENNGHLLGVRKVESGEPLEYYWGFLWDRQMLDASFEGWKAELRGEASGIPLKVIIKK